MKAAVETTLRQHDFEPALVDEILSLGRMKKAAAGTPVVGTGNQGQEMPIVVGGVLKVTRLEANGKGVFLYFLEAGEVCAMAITCCLEGKMAAFEVTAEEDAQVWMVPTAYLDTWIAKFPAFRRFVFRSYQTRFDELLNTLDSVVFSNMDERIYKYLLDKKQASGSYIIEKTHQQIAQELNTARVVVSRLLKQLEREGKIAQNRNRIEVL